MYYDKIAGFFAIRGTLRIRVQVNATRFQAGRLLLYYLPTPNYRNYGKLAGDLYNTTQLPAPTNPVANYVKFVRTGNLIFLSGHGPSNAEGKYTTGKLGKDLSIEEGYDAAKLTGINLLATLKAAVGDLSKIKRVVKVLGMVNSTDQFSDQPKVINGFSDLMVAVFGDKGKLVS